MTRLRIVVATLCLLVAGSPTEAQFESVGSLRFPTSGASEAQSYFLRGVAILHSFGWKQAIAEFQAAQRIDPDFAMAYWGETLCYNHPLFGSTPDDENPRAVLQRLGATRAERLAKAPTERERGFLDAVETLWGDGDYNDRRVAYMEAMLRLHERYPDDDEVSTFAAVATLSAARAMNDRTFRYEMRAGAIALTVFGKNPDHPGAPHYAIHAFDDPTHAPLALASALRYAEIAPAVAHARHMPTHIFIQHGMWVDVSIHNQIAYDVARDLWKAGDSVGDTVHPLDWGQYGDLQLGDYAKARTWIKRLEMVSRESDGQARAVSSLPLLNARYVVETEEWKTLPVTDDSAAAELLATGISAARTGDLTTAAQAEARLKALSEGGNAANEIMYREVAALVRLALGQGDLAVALMDEALEIVAGMRLPNGAANPVKPPYELYGELLLDLDRSGEAVTKFKTSLERMPGRARSLLGLARAAARSGDHGTAAEQYAKLRSNWQGRTQLAEYQEASRYLQQSNEQ
jgi:tetratricopeptide (TPR) repeat protein